MSFTITRRIGIDAGHRIATHGSKCRHLHGHRYTIEATCRATELRASGEQTDMVLDFGFLKDEMLKRIDAPCDHGLILSVDDADMLSLFCPDGQAFGAWHANLRADVSANGCAASIACRFGQKLYVIEPQPTAECLARHWFEVLAPTVRERSESHAELVQVRVEETPNCWATFGPGFLS
jgi:6-pyruvoyltetrahydropterin/6-carboxytetrahydropterin synthase